VPKFVKMSATKMRKNFSDNVFKVNAEDTWFSLTSHGKSRAAVIDPIVFELMIKLAKLETPESIYKLIDGSKEDIPDLKILKEFLERIHSEDLIDQKQD
jgi:hypothetical protein